MDKFQGIDVGRVNETVLTSVSRSDDKERITQIDLEIKKDQKITDTARLIIDKDKHLNHKKIYIDATGMGWGVFDILREDPQTRKKVIPIENVKKSLNREAGKDEDERKKTMKEDLYNNLKNLMEMGKAQLFDNPALKQSLRSIQCDYSDSHRLSAGFHSLCLYRRPP